MQKITNILSTQITNEDAKRQSNNELKNCHFVRNLLGLKLIYANQC